MMIVVRVALGVVGWFEDPAVQATQEQESTDSGDPEVENEAVRHERQPKRDNHRPVRRGG